jgi:hypothetical protein
MNIRKAVIFSITLHVGILTMAYVGKFFSFKRDYTTLNSGAIMVDFVEIGPISKAPKLAPFAQEAKEEPTPPGKTITAEVPEPLGDLKAEKLEMEEHVEEESQKNQDQPDLNPPAPSTQHDTAPVKEEPQKDVANTSPTANEESVKIKPKKEKPKKKKAPPKPKPTPSDKLLKNLQDSKKAGKKTKKKDPSDKKTKPTKGNVVKKTLNDILGDTNTASSPSQSGVNAQAVGSTLIGSEINALRRHFKPFWNPPIGIKGAQDLVVDIDLELSPEGDVLKATVVDEARAIGDPAFRAAAESAKRAVLNPAASPLPLPKEKYDIWKEMTLTFDPKKMM